MTENANDQCIGCGVLRSDRYTSGLCPGGCFRVNKLTAKFEAAQKASPEARREAESRFNSEIERLGQWLTRIYIFFGPSNGGNQERVVASVRRAHDDLGRLLDKAESELRGK